MKFDSFDFSLLVLIVFSVFCFGFLGNIILTRMDLYNARYEHCLALDKQWINGDCVK